VASARWGGLRQEPYKGDAVDGDNDGVVQEGTLWERPAGTRFVSEFGEEASDALDGSNLTQLRGLSLVDDYGRSVDYKPSWSSSALTIGERLGTLASSMGTVGDRGKLSDAFPVLSADRSPLNAPDKIQSVDKPKLTDEAEKLLSTATDRRGERLNISVPFSVDMLGKEPWDVQSWSRQFGGSIVRGRPVDVDDPRVPDKVYHVTPYLPDVFKDGTLRARGEGGLGGDSQDRIVSFTVNRAIADQLVSDMRLVSDLAKAGKANDLSEFRALIIKDQQRHNAFLSPQQVETVERSFQNGGAKSGINQYFSSRETAGGIPNPLFVGDYVDNFAKLSKDDIGIIEVDRENLRTGAMITDLDIGRGNLDELRVYGDVNVSRAVGASEPAKPERIQFSGDLPDTGDGIDVLSSIDTPHMNAMNRRIAQLGVDRDAMRTELERALKEASPELVAKASQWYSEVRKGADSMRQAVNSRFGSSISLEESAAVIAALSPAREFGKNVKDARDIMTVIAEDAEFTIPEDFKLNLKPEPLQAFLQFEQRMGDYGGKLKPSDLRDDELGFLVVAHPVLSSMGNGTGFTNVVRALALLRSGDIDRYLSGPKMRSFYSNIINPDGDRVTIDTWMYRAMIPPDSKLNTSKGLLTVKEFEKTSKNSKVQNLFQDSPHSSASTVPKHVGLYPEFAEAVREIAAKYDISPASLQAIVWEVQRLRAGDPSTDWDFLYSLFEGE